MSLHPHVIAPVPEATARVARAAFPQGPPSLTCRDALGTIVQDEDFATWCPLGGHPGLPPWRLALVTIMPFRENRADRQAAAAVRARSDGKELLSLALTAPGFDCSVLRALRDRLLAGSAEEWLLDKRLERCGAVGLLKARGQQRTASPHVLAALRGRNRLERVAETRRAALNAVATVAPAWLQAIPPLAWYERSSRRIEEARLPKAPAAREAYAPTVGEAGGMLLDAVETPEAPAGLRELPRLEALRRTGQRHDERPACAPASPGAPPARRVRFQARRALPPAAAGRASPDDVAARYRHQRDTAWTGSMVHGSETCDPTAPPLRPHVHTTPATVHEAQCTGPIQQALIEQERPPRDHCVEAASISSELRVASRDDQGSARRGPTRPRQGGQTQVEGAYTIDQCTRDCDQKQVRCPQGNVSAAWWEHGGGRGRRPILVAFAKHTCGTCPVRADGPRAQHPGRRLRLPPQEQYAALAAAPPWAASEEGQQL
jgi:transposase